MHRPTPDICPTEHSWKGPALQTNPTGPREGNCSRTENLKEIETKLFIRSAQGDLGSACRPFGSSFLVAKWQAAPVLCRLQPCEPIGFAPGRLLSDPCSPQTRSPSATSSWHRGSFIGQEGIAPTAYTFCFRLGLSISRPNSSCPTHHANSGANWSTWASALRRASSKAPLFRGLPDSIGRRSFVPGFLLLLLRGSVAFILFGYF